MNVEQDDIYWPLSKTSSTTILYLFLTLPLHVSGPNQWISGIICGIVNENDIYVYNLAWKSISDYGQYNSLLTLSGTM